MSDRTPAAEWRTKGEPDPHGKRYECEREDLALGKLSDDVLANGAFMNYDQRLSVPDMLNPKPGQHMPIVWMTAVKDRIRWLSRKLVEAEARAEVKGSSAPSAEPAVVLWQYRWLNPDGKQEQPPEVLAWKPVEHPPWQPLESKLQELRDYRYNDQPCYEVRPLFAAATQGAPTPAQLTSDEIADVVLLLEECGHGKDGGDYAVECPACTAAEKLKLAAGIQPTPVQEKDHG